ncbi:electron transport complex protein RnfD [Bacilli bacterium PM5-3]|nr:electron transport complex protein RnfD [Bacilli bacterium PM5-3]
MKFKYGVSPSYHNKVSTTNMMNDVTIALLFVAICSIVLQYSLYGIEGSIRAILIIAIAIITCVAVDYFYLKLTKVSKEKVGGTVRQNVPVITGLILAMTLPLGNLDSYEIFYVTFISAIIAELFGKLIYGGFGFNIFNPAGVGRAFALIAFGKYLAIPAIDGLASASPLTALSSAEGLSAVSQTFNNYTSLLFGAHMGTIGETMVIPIIVAGVYLIYKNVIDWVLPATSIITIAILAGVVSCFNGGFNIDYILIHVLSGGLIFGGIFMLTDPVTNPINRQGKMIYAIIFALLTFLIRVYASLPEGVVFSVLIVNMLVPMIDKFTANVTDVNVNKKVISVVATLVVAIVLTCLFQFV